MGDIVRFGSDLINWWLILDVSPQTLRLDKGAVCPCARTIHGGSDL